jgi:hypothetical protein
LSIILIDFSMNTILASWLCWLILLFMNICILVNIVKRH